MLKPILRRLLPGHRGAITNSPRTLLNAMLFAATSAIVAGIGGSPLLAQDDTDPRFYCRAEGRYLSNEDFARLALGYELEKKRANYLHDRAMPEQYEIGSVDGFFENNPEGYSVTRDPKFLRHPNPSWISRLSAWIFNTDKNVFILLQIPSDTVGAPKLRLAYFTDECGKINRDRTYSPSDQITE